MIRKVSAPEELGALPEKGVQAQKIRALLLSYGTGYDFCRFYISEDFALCEPDGSFVVCGLNGEGSPDELAEFFRFGGFSEIFCSHELGQKLSAALNCRRETAQLMRFERRADVFAETAETDPALDDVYDILRTSFDIEYYSWYTDISHRIRHGVSRARKLGDSALIIQYDINGEALLSQIATRPEARGRGGASRLVRAVCAELAESEVYLLCKAGLVPFYERLGFERAGTECCLFP